ncbi:hypothetical protein [Kitasatospora sp. NPDC056184]|uniref:hypothetical protein n=1 Tax=Kitasatospora sp. NPDC056184 TaxID=3345738 RepID=UPI0035D689C7
MTTTKKTTAPCQAHDADSWGNCPVAELRTVRTRLLVLLERYADGPLNLDYRSARTRPPSGRSACSRPS